MTGQDNRPDDATVATGADSGTVPASLSGPQDMASTIARLKTASRDSITNPDEFDVRPLGENTDFDKLRLNGSFGEGCILVTPKNMRLKGRVTIDASTSIIPTDLIVYLGQVGQKIHLHVRGPGVTVAIGDCPIRRLDVVAHLAVQSSLVIGDGTTIGSLKIQSKGAETFIGRDCMFSENIEIYCTRVHALIALEDRKATLMAPDLKCIIGDKVWIGRNVNLLSGANIGRGSVLGAHSVVAGKIGEHCTAAGNPCKTIRENVTWSRRSNGIDPVTYAYLTDQLGCDEIFDRETPPSSGEHLE